jgi:hypothetical protein
LSNSYFTAISGKVTIIYCSTDLSIAYEQKNLMNSLAFYGGEGIRTPDLRLAKPALCQLSYAPIEISNLEFET